MHPWRVRFNAARQRMQEEADEDEEILGLILGLQEVEEDVLQPKVAGGSRPGRRGNIERDRLQMHAQMMKDYFCDNPIYGPTLF
jgi:hypothetical protein